MQAPRIEWSVGQITPWRPLRKFSDRSIPKLDNLRRAARANLRVPLTFWAAARFLDDAGSLAVPPCPDCWPLIVRSASPTEDQSASSNAGQFVSVVVREAARFQEAVSAVINSLPTDKQGYRQGAVFVQPLIESAEAGVAFFDGFYYERTLAPGRNEDLTAGRLRGQVCRGHIERGEPWSEWLLTVHRIFGRKNGRAANLDVEFAGDEWGFILLQVRPALFAIRRNPCLTMANVRETVGDRPSPWMAAALVEAGRSIPFLKMVDPAIEGWQDSAVYEIAGRIWVNLSLAFRAADYFGLPRSLVTHSAGGTHAFAADRRLDFKRVQRNLPRLARLPLLALNSSWSPSRVLAPLDAEIATSQGLQELHRTTILALDCLISTALAIVALLFLIAPSRRKLGLPPAARLVTQDMMEEYEKLARLPSREDRLTGLDKWIERHGHRGPQESDLASPRFAELRDVLQQDLLTRTEAPSPTVPKVEARSSIFDLRSSIFGGWGSLLTRFFRPAYLVDEWREWNRDQMMRRWQRLRARILEEGQRLVKEGVLDAAEEVFLLQPADLVDGRPLREAVQDAKARRKIADRFQFPLTAPLDELEQIVSDHFSSEAKRTSSFDFRSSPEAPSSKIEDRRSKIGFEFRGIGLAAGVVEGEALVSDNLVTLLQDAAAGRHTIGADTILVVPVLEPSWAVLFPRLGGVVAEMGGELSHASILLREARKPAVVNCAGICQGVRQGDRLRLDSSRGVVAVIETSGS